MAVSRIRGRSTPVLLCLLMAGHSAAAQLEPRDLDGDPTTVEAYFDPDLDITWLGDANIGLSESFDSIRAPFTDYGSQLSDEGTLFVDGLEEFIDGANNHNYLGHNNWRLPVAGLSDRSCSVVLDPETDQPITWGTGCTAAEIGHLNARIQTTYGSVENAPFKNISKFDQFWLGSNGPAGRHHYQFGREGSLYFCGAGRCGARQVWLVHDGKIGNEIDLATTTLACRHQASDPDADGYGYEYGSSCSITAESTPPPVITNRAIDQVVDLVRLQWEPQDIDNRQLECETWVWSSSDDTYIGDFPKATYRHDSATGMVTEVVRRSQFTDVETNTAPYRFDNGMYFGLAPISIYGEISDGSTVYYWDSGNSYQSCKGTNPTGNAQARPQACIDTQPTGDGWGWNGSTSCRVDQGSAIAPNGTSLTGIVGEPQSSNTSAENTTLATNEGTQTDVESGNISTQTELDSESGVSSTSDQSSSGVSSTADGATANSVSPTSGGGATGMLLLLLVIPVFGRDLSELFK